MKKRTVILTMAMAMTMIFGTTAMAEEGLSGKFTLFHFHEEDGGGTSKAFWNPHKASEAAQEVNRKGNRLHRQR